MPAPPIAPRAPVAIGQPETPVAAAPSSANPPAFSRAPSVAAVAPSPSPLPPATAAGRPSATAAAKERSDESTIETMKRLADYMPEVRLGKAIYRWVKSQPRRERQSLEPAAPESR